MKKNTTILVLAVVVLALLWFTLGGSNDKIYATDTTLSGDYVVAEDERIVIKDGATLTVEGSFDVSGEVACEGGPLNLIVIGPFTVSGSLECFRVRPVDDGNLGSGISIVVTDIVEFTDTALVLTNGHIQVVDDESLLATTQGAIDEMYDSSAIDAREDTWIGPFIPIDTIISRLVPTKLQDEKMAFVAAQTPSVPGALIPTVLAASHGEPSVDAGGFEVLNARRFGGRWVVGGGGLVPEELEVPTPPKGIKKIIVNFNFGQGTMHLQNFELWGPDGRQGDSDRGMSCDAKGKKGEDAFRLNVRAPNIRIANLILNLGDGGEGGIAETLSDCDDASASGGEGGNPGNFRMVSSGTFEITGSFRINPGVGGPGGDAIANGKIGEQGCSGENGGNATAIGGKGGDNKKGVSASGSVTGLDNIEIGNIVGGAGAAGIANGGAGGDGEECGCDGGSGGDATATGGSGGDTTSRRFTSIGGNGGNVDAIPGIGGVGGSCGPEADGGGGGRGGDVIDVAPGVGGIGKNKTGEPGDIQKQVGGNGGRGGDGCLEGVGGFGGFGTPKGEDGEDGENMCVFDEEEIIGSYPGFEVVTPEISYLHIFGGICPDPGVDDLVVRGPVGGGVSLGSGSMWLDSPGSGTIDTEIVQLELAGTSPFGEVRIPLSFNCNVSDLSPHKEEVRVPLTLTNPDGSFAPDSFFDVFFELEVPGQ